MANNSSSPTDLGSPPPAWLLRAYTRVNVWVYRLSKGKLMNHLEGRPICLITMTGAKSGKKRTVPLMYVPDGDRILLVASQGGMPKHPVWYFNLIANPKIIVEQGGVRRELIARVANTDEKSAVWPTCIKFYPDYDIYQLRTNRDIPVFICEPAA